jgi:hypothetical protein
MAADGVAAEVRRSRAEAQECGLDEASPVECDQPSKARSGREAASRLPWNGLDGVEALESEEAARHVGGRCGRLSVVTASPCERGRPADAIATQRARQRQRFGAAIEALLA